MKKTILLLIFVHSLSSLCIADEPRLRPSSWATPIISESLENWHKVDNLLYRSEQPDSQAMDDLEKFGVRRVLNLRQFNDDNDEAEETDLQLFHVPFNAAMIKEVYVVESLKIITSSDEPILVHCWHGSDRTGTIVAMYRIVVQGWTKEAAIDELKNGGYGYHSLYGNIVKYLEGVNVEEIKEQLKIHTHGS
jgi:protein tyrosine/serine phosphatase